VTAEHIKLADVEYLCFAMLLALKRRCPEVVINYDPDDFLDGWSTIDGSISWREFGEEMVRICIEFQNTNSLKNAVDI
jgi:hypothetical protein